MKSLYLLAALCCLVISACGSPIARPEEAEAHKEVGRQAAAPAAPAASADDDDDDDDDEDDDDVDLDDALSDDDDDDDEDDDEEESDDDDDDDYLERFFDDILGGGEDDDDEDEPSAVQPVVAPADTVAAAPAAPVAAVAPVEDAAAAASEEAAAGESDAEANVDDVEPEAGQKEPASAEVESAAAAAASAEDTAAADPEEDDDDDEDDIADALDPEDDDDDEEDDDEEDDDDEDDDITDALGRNISTKHSRALAETTAKKSPIPAVYIVKYNRFIDNILEKMNDVLRRSYDPVNVKLQPIDASKKSTKPKKNKNKNKNKTKSNKRKTSHKKKNSARGSTEKIKEPVAISETPAKIDEKINDLRKEKPIQPIAQEKPAEQVQNDALQSRAWKEKATESGKAKPTTKPKAPTKATKKPKPPVKTTTKKPVTKPTKVKTTSEKNKPRAKGTLYGLSSMRRVGDVAVNIMTNYTTVKSNFAVGPLILRVEKEVGRGAKKEIKSATATTAEMTGKISLRVNNDGVATLHSIKVLQPKQVRVDSNHERTRELVWRRSARIAHVVSEKLLSASKPMFQQTVEE